MQPVNVNGLQVVFAFFLTTFPARIPTFLVLLYVQIDFYKEFITKRTLFLEARDSGTSW